MSLDDVNQKTIMKSRCFPRTPDIYIRLGYGYDITSILLFDLLTHWGRDKIAAIPHTTFSKVFYEWKCMNFLCILFLNVRINNIPSLVQIMACRRPGDKPLSEPIIIILLTHIYWCDSVSKAGPCQYCVVNRLLNPRDTLNTTTDQDRWTNLQSFLNIRIMFWKHGINSWEIMKLIEK